MLSKANRRTARTEQKIKSQQTGIVMPRKQLKAEIAALTNISERLVHLAEDHPAIGETFLTIAATVSNTATILAVLLETKPNLGHMYERTN